MIFKADDLWNSQLPVGTRVRFVSAIGLVTRSLYSGTEFWTTGRYRGNTTVKNSSGQEYTGVGATWEVLPPPSGDLGRFL